MNSNYEQELIDLVNKYMKNIPNIYSLSADNISTQSLMDKMLEWPKLNSVLIAKDVQAKVEYQNAKDDFDFFISNATVSYREKEKQEGVKKGLSTNEIEMKIRVDQKELYNELNSKMQTSSMKVAYFRRLLDNFQNYQYLLTKCCDLLKLDNIGGGSTNT